MYKVTCNYDASIIFNIQNIKYIYLLKTHFINICNKLRIL